MPCYGCSGARCPERHEAAELVPTKVWFGSSCHIDGEGAASWPLHRRSAALLAHAFRAVDAGGPWLRNARPFGSLSLLSHAASLRADVCAHLGMQAATRVHFQLPMNRSQKGGQNVTWPSGESPLFCVGVSAGSSKRNGGRLARDRQAYSSYPQPALPVLSPPCRCSWLDGSPVLSPFRRWE